MNKCRLPKSTNLKIISYIGVLSIELNLGAPYLKIGTYNESIIEIAQADQINIYKSIWGLYEV